MTKIVYCLLNHYSSKDQENPCEVSTAAALFSFILYRLKIFLRKRADKK